jgi:hypothetical protein
LQVAIVSATVAELYGQMRKANGIAIVIRLRTAHACHGDSNRRETAFV